MRLLDGALYPSMLVQIIRLLYVYGSKHIMYEIDLFKRIAKQAATIQQGFLYSFQITRAI